MVEAAEAMANTEARGIKADNIARELIEKIRWSYRRGKNRKAGHRVQFIVARVHAKRTLQREAMGKHRVAQSVREFPIAGLGPLQTTIPRII